MGRRQATARITRSLTDMYDEPLGEVDFSEYELEGGLVYIELIEPAPGGATQTPEGLPPAILLLAIMLTGLAIGLARYIVKGRTKTATIAMT